MTWLGYCPIVPAVTVEEKLKRHRRHLGLTAFATATLVGIDMTTLLAWEAGRKNPKIQKRSREKCEIIFGLSPSEPLKLK